MQTLALSQAEPGPFLGCLYSFSIKVGVYVLKRGAIGIQASTSKGVTWTGPAGGEFLLFLQKVSIPQEIGGYSCST